VGHEIKYQTISCADW